MTAAPLAFARPELDRRTRAITLALIGIVLLSSFLGRYDVVVLGFRVRIEQITPLMLAAWLVGHPALRGSFLRAARHPVVLVFAVFIGWNVISTLLFSPDYVWSASILAWLVIDIVLLTAVMTLRDGARFLARAGAASTAPWALLGLGAFAIANLTRGAVPFGTDFDWLYEIYVARVTAIEANIYATILILWALVATTMIARGWRAVLPVAVLVPLGLIASQTRTSVFSMLVGLGVFALATLVRDRRTPRAAGRRVLPAAVVAAALLVSFALVTLIPSTGTGRDAPVPTATAGATPTPTYVPDPTDPETQNKLGDIDLRGGTIGFRITVAEIAAQDITGVHLWFGNGTNTFGIRHEQPGTPGVSGHIIMLPVQVLYDGGVVGLVLLVALFGTVIAASPRRRLPAVLGVLASYAISTALTSMFWFAATWILLAVLLRPVDDLDADGDAGR
ncbi:O-antigen ligase family protein [Galbitalea sp. SE-J8]|uniref:O-antigen ligase family protein n=1 Tax=Galbitalea sp. SE-J8 TaxID=3054952 RepID=UPI00259CCA50|nr:O-antigen ligase family protein [Galbitalea sp. SE-J8]MDM4761507.1 O-antigen ligase family protein [Galbitalea sp. SE-J8]